MSKRTASESDQESEASGGSDTKRLRGDESKTIHMLRQLLKEKDEHLARSRREKKSLLQTVRRKDVQIEKLEQRLQDEFRAKQKSLDVKRVADKTGVVGKSGSWLTPSGAVSLAVSGQKSLPALSYYYFFLAIVLVEIVHSIYVCADSTAAARNMLKRNIDFWIEPRRSFFCSGILSWSWLKRTTCLRLDGIVATSPVMTLAELLWKMSVPAVCQEVKTNLEHHC